MANPIKIGIASDTRDFVKGVKSGIIEPLERVQDALEDVSDSGKDTGKDLERGLKDSQKETEQARKEYDKLGKEVQQAGRKGRELGDDMKAGTDKAQDGIREVGEEASGTAREAAASFDGSAASIGDAFQEVAANAFAGFGPAGMIAGIAAAAGIGIIFSEMEKGAESSEAFKERVNELADELIDVGTEGGPSISFLVDKLKEMATATEDSGDNLSELYKLSDSAASGFDKIAQAYAGNVDGLDDLIDKEKDHKRALEDEAAAIDTTKSTSYGAAISRAEDSQKIVDGLELARSAAEDAQLAEDAYIASGGPELEAKAERAETYATSISESLTDAGDDWETYADKETGALNLEEYNANIEARVTAMQNYQANMSTIQGTISDEAYNYLVSLGADAAPLLQAYADAPLDQKQRTASNWGTLGNAASTEYTNKLAAGIPDTMPGPVVAPTLDATQFNRDLARITAARSMSVTLAVNAALGNLGGKTG